MYQISGLNPIAEDHSQSPPPAEEGLEAPDLPIESQVAAPESVPVPNMPSARFMRRMRSAGNLLNQLENAPSIVPTRVSSGGVVNDRNSEDAASSSLIPPSASRFNSLGTAGGQRSASAMGNYTEAEKVSPIQSNRLNTPRMVASTSARPGKWGFLRKMSMNKIKADKGATMTASASANLKSMPPPLNHTSSDPVPTLPMRPGMSSTRSAMTLPTRKAMTSDVSEFGLNSTKMPSSASTLPISGLPSVTSMHGSVTGRSNTRGKRRSFLPLDGPPSINISIPSTTPFMPTTAMFEAETGELPSTPSEETIDDVTMIASQSGPIIDSPSGEIDVELRCATGLESIKSYLRDLFDLSRPPIEPYGGFEVVGGAESITSALAAVTDRPATPSSAQESSMSFAEARRARPPAELQISRNPSSASVIDSKRSSMAESAETSFSGKKFKNDRSKRTKVIWEIYETERTYVRGLGELVAIYTKPASQSINPGNVGGETVVPALERKIVFGGIESILTIHRDNLLPALERAIRPLLDGKDDEEGTLSALTAHQVGEVFRTYITYMKQYSTYINNFDNALSRMQTWTAPSSAPPTPAFPSKPTSPNFSAIAMAGVSIGAGMGPVSLPGVKESAPHSGLQMTTAQRKRVKAFLKVS